MFSGLRPKWEGVENFKKPQFFVFFEFFKVFPFRWNIVTHLDGFSVEISIRLDNNILNFSLVFYKIDFKVTLKFWDIKM